MARYLAPAKINLFLHVVGRRADGYHELDTYFQFIDLADTLEIAADTSGEISRVHGNPSIAPAQDLCIRAAHGLRNLAGDQRLGASISIFKKIPIGAGLGGGSSDAATTLLALNDAWELGVSRDELATIGLALGADVPVFVRGRAAWATGIGERLAPQPGPPLTLVLVVPPVHVATADVFAALARAESDPAGALFARPNHPDAVLDLEDMPATNHLEPVVRARFEQVGWALDWLRAHGAARMSGSGGAVFLPVMDADAGARVAAALPSWWTEEWRIEVVQTQNRHPFDDAAPAGGPQ